MAGQWTGRLGNGGETLTVQLGEVTIQQLTYDDAWHPTTDGAGFSLEIVDPTSSDVNLWSQKGGWRPSGTIGGNPGAISRLPGDANGDGRFNSADLLHVLQAGQYLDDIAGNSTFAEGDWNGDGDFDRLDLVLALQYGAYEGP